MPKSPVNPFPPLRDESFNSWCKYTTAALVTGPISQFRNSSFFVPSPWLHGRYPVILHRFPSRLPIAFCLCFFCTISATTGTPCPGSGLVMHPSRFASYGGPSRHISFGIPRMIAPYFRCTRDLLKDLCQLAAREEDPLPCPRCQKEKWIVSPIDGRELIERILCPLGL